jgi:hypothetical protein
MPKLKVFRTPIGFHDAYVAAPRQKAALKAWGSDADLFARGVAELITDPDLAEEPLARPGEVIKRLRGTAAEQIAALPADKLGKQRSRDRATPASVSFPGRKSPPKQKPAPRPDRAALNEVERSLAAVEQRQQAERKILAEEEAALEKKRRALEKKHATEVGQLQRKVDQAKVAYDRAVGKWQG